jgi:hypothetical protein
VRLCNSSVSIRYGGALVNLQSLTGYNIRYCRADVVHVPLNQDGSCPKLERYYYELLVVTTTNRRYNDDSSDACSMVNDDGKFSKTRVKQSREIRWMVSSTNRFVRFGRVYNHIGRNHPWGIRHVSIPFTLRHKWPGVPLQKRALSRRYLDCYRLIRPRDHHL